MLPTLTKNFKTWLVNSGSTESSIHKHLQNIRYISNWSIQEGLDLNYLTYQELTEYVRFLQDQNLKTSTINNRINSVVHYNTFLQDKGLREDNPARKIYIKDTKAKIKTILSKQELEDLYANFPSNPYFLLRNKTMLGLVIYQACNTSTLKALKVQDINLEQGRVHLPATRRSNPRNLPLQPNQIFILHRYLETRNTEFLFEQVSNRMEQIKQFLKQMNSRVTTMEYFRASVIVDWLKHYNLREVQYFTGHKSIRGTENYLMQGVEELKKSLRDFHPLG